MTGSKWNLLFISPYFASLFYYIAYKIRVMMIWDITTNAGLVNGQSWRRSAVLSCTVLICSVFTLLCFNLGPKERLLHLNPRGLECCTSCSSTSDSKVTFPDWSLRRLIKCERVTNILLHRNWCRNQFELNNKNHKLWHIWLYLSVWFYIYSLHYSW